MTTVLFIHGGKVTDETPSQRFALRLDKAIEYYQAHRTTEEIIFLISGRWGRVTDDFMFTEAEVGKRYLLARLPEAKVLKEDISVEIVGNYAFSKPLIAHVGADKVVVYTSEVLDKRVRYLVKRIFADAFSCTFDLIEDELSGNTVLQDKEVNAMKLLEKLFADVSDGDDAGFREKILYSTPWYFKGVIDDKTFFDTYWEGGFEHYLHGIATRNEK